MLYQRAAEEVLAKWREVERALAEAQPDSSDAEYLTSEAARLRDEYQLLVQEELDRGREPPPGLPAPKEIL